MSDLAQILAVEEALRADDYADVRRRAQRALMQHGFPDLKTEDWKYTSLRVLQKREFGSRSEQVANPPALPLAATVLPFSNGQLVQDGLVLPAGVTLEPLAAAALESVEYAGRQDAFAWLNLARFEQAWKLRITGVQEQPLVLAFTTTEDFAAIVHPRLVVELAETAEATLIELQSGGGAGLVNTVLDLKLGRGSSCRHVMVREAGETAQVIRTEVDVSRDGSYHGLVLDGGSRWRRQDLKLRLNEAGALGELDGTVLLDSRQHVDYHTAMDHCTGHTNSRELFRFLADGSGVGVFNGRIHIHADSDDSHSDLNIATLLLGADARINAKPELEIYSEEVTAAHGATIGQLDDDALFYLRARGISAEDANALLKYGFAAAPFERLPEGELRDWLLERLREQL